MSDFAMGQFKPHIFFLSGEWLVMETLRGVPNSNPHMTKAAQDLAARKFAKQLNTKLACPSGT